MSESSLVQSAYESSPRIASTYYGKRVFDLVIASILIVPAVVVMAVAILAVWLTSGSPVLFPQERVGQGWNHFTIWKIRTMQNGKIFPVGRVLRATGIDELPQLFQVLTGTMSIVGPRPHTPDEAAELQAINGMHKVLIDGWKQGLISPVCIQGKWKELRFADPNFDPTQIELENFRKESFRGDLRLVVLAAVKAFRGLSSFVS